MNDKVPLSLQRQCFSYVVHHLEEFPAEVLDLLPLRIREELLLTLAPADIIQLEGSKALEGVDMHSVLEVMKERLAHCEPFWTFSNSVRFDLPLKWRNLYIEDPLGRLKATAAYLLFHSCTTVCHNRSDTCFFNLFRILLSQPGSSPSRKMPRRYEEICYGPFPLRDTAVFLLQRCQITLKCMFFSVQHFCCQPGSILMQDLFRDVEEICFFDWPSSLVRNRKVFSSIVRAALTQSSAGLHTLILSDFPHQFAGELLKKTTELFSQAEDHPGLQHIRISLSISVMSMFAAEQLQSLLDLFRSSLEELYLSDWCIFSFGLCESVCSLTRMPQFSRLTLYGNSLTKEFVYELLSNFLPSSCRELHMGKNKLVGTFGGYIQRIEMAEDACEFKCLDLQEEGVNNMVERLAYLLQGVRSIRLKSLKIRSHIIAECIARHSDVVIEEMEVSCDLPDEQTAKKVLQLLALNTHLKKLVLRCMKVVPEVLAVLAAALRKQARLGSLQELVLVGFEFSDAPGQNQLLKELFNSLFSFSPAQLREMKVVIPDHLRERMVQALIVSWLMDLVI